MCQIMGHTPCQACTCVQTAVMQYTVVTMQEAVGIHGRDISCMQSMERIPLLQLWLHVQFLQHAVDCCRLQLLVLTRS